MQQTMDIFIPKGVFTTKRSVSGTSEPNTRDRRFNSTKGIFSTKRSVSGTAEPNTSDRVYYISGAVSGGVLVGIALLLAVYFHRRRSDSSGIYTPDPMNTKYDTSIIFSSKDEKFIVKKLLPFLEGEKHFKCCVHFRDWEPGEVVPTSMAKMVYNCKKVIAVISKHFLASNFCQEELNMALGRLAHQGDSSLIVINLGVALEELPPALQTRTFLDLTSSTEKKTWRTRLERQISAENSRIVYSDIFEDDNKRNSERLLEREETSSENTVGRLYISGGYSHVNDCSTSSNSESSIGIQV